jgi:HD superfamily phosphohydrolase YqeK
MTMDVTMDVMMDIGTSRGLESPGFGVFRRRVPGEAEIDSLLTEAGTPLHIILHQRRVAEVSAGIGELYARRAPLDLELLIAAARLHDILKTRPGHAKKGAAFLTKNGFPEVGEVVGGHMDLPSPASAETKLLYLADKYVNGTKVVSLREREELAREKFSSDREALETALHRMGVAFEIERRLKKIAGEFYLP